MTSFWFVKLILHPTFYPALEIKDLMVNRQNRWRISKTEAKVHDTYSTVPRETLWKNKNDQVRSLLLKKNGFVSSDNDSLMLYLHGGGFISQSPETHLVITKDWAIQMESKA